MTSGVPGGSFAGRTPRDMLSAFYQKYNPSKVAEVDRILLKYQGKEEQMFRQLANKYNLDPSTFGLSALAGGMDRSPAFGIGSALGGAQAALPFGQATGGGFGQASPLGSSGGFGGANPQATVGAPVFGSSPSGASPFGSSSFGAIAHSSPQGGFAGGFGTQAPAPSPFGASTPFGAPRR